MSDACETCGVPPTEVARLRDQLDTLRLAHDELQKELIVVRANNRRLTNDRNARRLADPLKRLADQVFDYWNAKLMDNKAREFTGKRLEAVLQRLRAVPQDELEDRYRLILRAVDGVAKLPYVTDKGRAAAGLKKERQVELELICRSEDRLHRFAGYGEAEPAQAEQAPRAIVPTSGQEAPLFLNRPDPFERVMACLRIEFGADTVMTFRTYGGRREFWAVCPAHDHVTLHPPTLRVREQGGIRHAKLDLACTEQCLPSQIRSRLLEIEAAQAARVAGDGTYRRLALLLAAVGPDALIEASAEAAGAG